MPRTSARCSTASRSWRASASASRRPTSASRRTCSMRCSPATPSGAARASPPTILITDFREVPTWSEFLILKDRFEARGVPTVVADPRDLTFDGTTLVADGRRIDMVYRRVLVNDVIARAGRLPRAGRRHRQRHGVHGQRPALQDPAQEGLLRAAHRRGRDRTGRALPAVRGRARGDRAGHPVDARRRGRAHDVAAPRDDRPAAPTPASIATRSC